MNVSIQEIALDTARALARPADFFSKLEVGTNLKEHLAEPLAKVGFYSVISAILYFVWVKLEFGVAAGEPMRRAYAYMGAYYVLAVPFRDMLALLLGSYLVLFISVVVGGDERYLAAAQVMAAISVTRPLAALFTFAGHVDFIFGLTATLIVNLFGMWLFYNGLVHGLRGNKAGAIAVTSVMSLASLVPFIKGLRTL